MEGKVIMTSDQELAETRQQDEALERARGQVAEMRRLWEQGAPFAAHLPLLDQLEADLNTLRPQHAGYPAAADGTALYGDGTRPTAGRGVDSGAIAGTGQTTVPVPDGRGVAAVANPAFGHTIGPDGLTDEERAAGLSSEQAGTDQQTRREAVAGEADEDNSDEER